MRQISAIALLAMLSGRVLADLPVSGWHVPELAIFDDIMQDVMASEGVTGGVLAISVDGRIVYQRGFGWLDDAEDGRFMPENTPMRIASVEKPLTSAAVRRLVETGFDELEWSDRVFDINGNGGILEYIPWSGLGDSRLESINVGHCFNHIGGWDRAIATICTEEGDPMFDDVCIADEMGLDLPPDQHQLIRYMLSEPLQFTPGTLGCQNDDGNAIFCYSNFGYMLLGRVVHTVSGFNTLEYIRRHIITTDMWVPRSEILYGRTFEDAQDPREPTYHDSRSVTNIFDPDGDDVPYPYGGWYQENLLGHGNLVCSAVALLRFMDRYQVAVGGNAGVPLYGAAPMTNAHSGLLPGTSTVMRQRADRVNYVLLFNQSYPSEPSIDAMEAVEFHIDWLQSNSFTWPTTEVDGFWVDTEYNGDQPEFGGFNAPFRSIIKAVNSTGGDGMKLRFKPGDTAWVGTLNNKMRLDAPFGIMRIGAN